MRKNYLTNCQSIANTTDLTLRQMCDIPTRLVSEQDEISSWETIGWENHPWKYLSLIGDERVINLQRTKVYSFQILYCVLVRFSNPPLSIKRCMGTKIGGVQLHRNTETWTELMESHWNSSGTSSQDLIRCSSLVKVKDLLSRSGEKPETFTGRILFMSMFNDISCGTKDNEKECLANAKVVWQMPESSKYLQRSLVLDTSHSVVLVLKRNGTVSVKTVHKESGTILRKRCWWNSRKADVQFSVLRAHCPEADSKARDMENCRYTVQPILETIETIFRIILCKPAQSLRSTRGDI